MKHRTVGADGAGLGTDDAHGHGVAEPRRDCDGDDVFSRASGARSERRALRILRAVELEHGEIEGGSRPTTLAENSRSSASLTFTSLDPATTCALVTSDPSIDEESGTERLLSEDGILAPASGAERAERLRAEGPEGRVVVELRWAGVVGDGDVHDRRFDSRDERGHVRRARQKRRRCKRRRGRRNTTRRRGPHAGANAEGLPAAAHSRSALVFGNRR